MLLPRQLGAKRHKKQVRRNMLDKRRRATGGFVPLYSRVFAVMSGIMDAKHIGKR